MLFKKEEFKIQIKFFGHWKKLDGLYKKLETNLDNIKFS